MVIILFVQISFYENNFLSSDSNLPLLIFICNICDRNKRNVQQFIHSKHSRLLIVLGTCLHGGGGLQVGKVTRLSIQSVILVDHVYITVSGVTRQDELTPLSRVKFFHVYVSRWGNLPSRVGFSILNSRKIHSFAVAMHHY